MRADRSHPSRRRGRSGLTLIESLVTLVVVLAFIGWYALVAKRRNCCGGWSPRLVCGSNLKGFGTSSKIYANDNRERWPTPTFDESKIGAIDYAVRVGGGEGSPRSPSRSQPNIGGENGARQLSVTRSFWMLVRLGDITVNQFTCPQAGDKPDPAENLELYYDFADRRNISYGYQVPFGPPDTRAREGCDNRMILAADRGPYMDASVALPPLSILDSASTGLGADARKAWAPYNSPNHGGEGQNVLFADGHASFERTPVVGIDGDNIYTIALDNERPESRMIGESPWKRSAPPFSPQTESGSLLSCTDSVIFP